MNFIFPLFNQTWWITPVLIGFKKLRQEDCYKFKPSLVYYGSLNKNGSYIFEYLVIREWHYLRRIRRCGVTAVGVAMLEEVCL